MKVHFKTAWDYIRRSPFQAASAAFVLTLTFFVATIVAVLTYSSSKLISYFETRPQVIAFLKDTTTESGIAALQHKLAGDIHIKEIKYVSKEEALSIYKKATSDNPLLGQLVSPSIFPASLEFSVTDLSFAQGIIDNLKAETTVDSVGFTAALGGSTSLNDVVARLKTITTYVRWGGIVFVGLLAVTSLVVLLVIVSMRIVGRKEEIEILNLIGATPKFIRSPILIEALIYSICGTILGWAIAFIAVLYLAPTLVSYFGEIPVLPKEAGGIFGLFGSIFAVEFFAGAVLALLGALIAISRVRKSR
jgi:cell division transport system permease protein